jgi:lipopolysaccharide transport system ATP-binding protein
MAGPLLHLSGVGKDYAKLDTNAGRLKLVVNLLRGRGAAQVFRALDDVSFDLAAGESLGIIGENGAGKSTLLKIVAGVVRPDTGQVEVNGRVGALLELGAGFHPEYTGRENVFLAAALMNMGRAETARRLDEILSFADIGSHIDQPIKHYSTGMVMRLGFAVATTLRPDILITDEVLAVGDESFQKKCIAWMEKYLETGGTLLLCSHGMYHIQKLCSQALWLRQGRTAEYGDAFKVTQAYLAYHERKTGKEATGAQTTSSGEYAVRDVWLENEAGERASSVALGGRIALRGLVHSPDGRPPCVAVGVLRADGTPVYGTTNEIDGAVLSVGDHGLHEFTYLLDPVALLPGEYLLRAHAMDPEGMRTFDTKEALLQVAGRTREIGLVRLSHLWETRGSSGSGGN